MARIANPSSSSHPFEESSLADDNQGHSGGNQDEEPNTDLAGEDDLNRLRSQLFDLQLENDNLKWKATVLEAEKLSKALDVKDMQGAMERQKALVQSLESDTQRLSEQCKKLQQEQ